MKHVPVNRLLAICCLLLLTGLPFSCIELSRIVEDHCCVPEKDKLDKAQKAYEPVAANAAEKNAAFVQAAANLGTAAGNWVAATKLWARNLGTMAAFNAARTSYNTAITVYTNALAAVRPALTQKHEKQEAVNTADVALFACNLTCPINVTCCPGSKNTEKLLTLSAALAAEKLADEVGIQTARLGVQTAINNAFEALQDFNNDECSFAIATTACVSSRFTATTLGQQNGTPISAILPTLVEQSKLADEQKRQASTDLANCRRDNNCQ